MSNSTHPQIIFLSLSMFKVPTLPLGLHYLAIALLDYDELSLLRVVYALAINVVIDISGRMMRDGSANAISGFVVVDNISGV